MTAVFFFIFYPTDIILLQRENAIVSIEPVIKGPYLSELCLHKSEEKKKWLSVPVSIFYVQKH